MEEIWLAVLTSVWETGRREEVNRGLGFRLLLCDVPEQYRDLLLQAAYVAGKGTGRKGGLLRPKSEGFQRCGKGCVLRPARVWGAKDGKTRSKKMGRGGGVG